MFHLILENTGETDIVSSDTEVYPTWNDAYYAFHKCASPTTAFIGAWIEFGIKELDVKGPCMYFCSEDDVTEKEGKYFLTQVTKLKSVRHFKEEYWSSKKPRKLSS